MSKPIKKVISECTKKIPYEYKEHEMHTIVGSQVSKKDNSEIFIIYKMNEFGVNDSISYQDLFDNYYHPLLTKKVCGTFRKTTLYSDGTTDIYDSDLLVFEAE